MIEADQANILIPPREASAEPQLACTALAAQIVRQQLEIGGLTQVWHVPDLQSTAIDRLVALPAIRSRDQRAKAEAIIVLSTIRSDGTPIGSPIERLAWSLASDLIDPN